MSTNDALSALQLIELFGFPDCVFTVGLPASTKSTFAEALAAEAGYTRLNSDLIRKELWGDESKQGDPQRMFGVLMARYREALSRGDKIIIDNTSLTRSARKTLVKMARSASRAPFLLVFDSPLADCMRRNRIRERVVPDNVMKDMAADLISAGPPLPAEALFRAVRPGTERGQFILVEQDAPLLVYQPLVPILDKTKLDVIGDIHGCYDELRALLKLLDWKIEETGRMPDGLPAYSFTAPEEDRIVGLVGDLIDRGPKSDRVLNLVDQMVAQQLAASAQGNHDNKGARLLKGNNVKVGDDLAETMRQIRQHGPEFEARVLALLKGLPFKIETPELILVHAAYKAGLPRKVFEDLAIYGEVDGTVDADGRPVRGNQWRTDYSGNKSIVHGHVPIDEVLLVSKDNGVGIWNIDTSAVFGGSLTAVRFPERTVFSVKSKQYANRSAH